MRGARSVAVALALLGACAGRSDSKITQTQDTAGADSGVPDAAPDGVGLDGSADGGGKDVVPDAAGDAPDAHAADTGGDGGAGDTGDASADPLLSALTNSEGCFVSCDGPPPGPECVVWCPQDAAAPGWEWDHPSRCEDPHSMSDCSSVPPGDPSCWAPPASWCADGGGARETPACSPDGSTCCNFGSTCIPCGWIDCFDEDAPAFCAPLVAPGASPALFATCPVGLVEQQQCILCGTALVCALPKPAPRNPSACPVAHPAGPTGGACDFGPEVACTYPALGCPAGSKPANTCRCTNGLLTCDRPFHHCTPIPSPSAPDDPLRAYPPHRPEAPVCPEPPPEAPACAASYPDGAHPSTCTTAADCPADSVCLDVALEPDSTACGCVPVGCRTDADCPGGQACACGTLAPGKHCGGMGAPPCGHTCFEADCLTDADCGQGNYCVPDGLCTGALHPGPLRCVGGATAPCFSDLECTGDDQCGGVGPDRACAPPPICD